MPPLQRRFPTQSRHYRMRTKFLSYSCAIVPERGRALRSASREDDDVFLLASLAGICARV
jgi:hypothetical protein